MNVKDVNLDVCERHARLQDAAHAASGVADGALSRRWTLNHRRHGKRYLRLGDVAQAAVADLIDVHAPRDRACRAAWRVNRHREWIARGEAQAVVFLGDGD